jgi:hypothetical protein
MDQPLNINLQKVLDNEEIIKFIDILNISQERKNELKEKLPSFTNEEKVFLWKTLVDIYKLDRAEEEEIKILKDFFEESEEKEN